MAAANAADAGSAAAGSASAGACIGALRTLQFPGRTGGWERRLRGMVEGWSGAGHGGQESVGGGGQGRTQGWWWGGDWACVGALRTGHTGGVTGGAGHALEPLVQL